MQKLDHESQPAILRSRTSYGTSVEIVSSPGVWALIIIAFLSPWATYINVGPGLTAVTLVISMVAAYYILCLFAGRQRNIGTMTVWFFVYVLLIYCSYYWTLAPEVWGSSLYWWIACFATFFASFAYLRTPIHFRYLCYSSVLGAIFSGLNFQFGYDEFGGLESRYTSFGVNSNFTSYVISGVVFMILITYRSVGFPKLIRSLIPPIIGFMLYLQILLDTRGGIISVIAVICVFYTRKLFKPSVQNFITISMLILAISVSMGAVDALIGIIDSHSSRSTGDLSGRTLIWSEAIIWIIGNPIIGIGPYAFPEVSISGVGAHNFIFIIALETGFFGLIIMVGFFCSTIRYIYKSTDRTTAAFLMSMFSAYWLPVATSGHWETAPFSWLVIGFMARISTLKG